MRRFVTLRAGPASLGFLCAGLLGVVAALCIAPARAAPPPPNFWDLTLRNETPNPASWVDVSLWHAVPPDYELLAEYPSVRNGLDLLPAGRSLTLGTPGWYGVARIRVSVFAGGGYASAEIEAPRMDFDGDGRDEWSGFCPLRPDGSAAFLGARVLPAAVEGGPLRLELQGLARWGDWSQLIVHTVDFQ